MTSAFQKFIIMRIYIKTVRDGFSEEVTLIRDLKDEQALSKRKMVTRAFQADEQFMRRHCGREVMTSAI